MSDRSTTGKRTSPGKNSATARQKSGATPHDPKQGNASAASQTGSSRNKLMNAQQAIGGFLRATREAQRLTQEQVASMTKGSPWQLSRAAISAIERGQNFPGMEAMLALSNVLHVDPKELVERARLSTVVPVDVTGHSFEDLDEEATQYFWAGDFRRALSIYDAMLERLALEDSEDPDEIDAKVARLEVRRATALKRSGALLSAIATAERAISLASKHPDIQSSAYVALSDLQCQRGNLPLAKDAAERSIELADENDAKRLGWAWQSKANVHYLTQQFEEARQSYIRARELARASSDDRHLTHIEGNIGMCWLGLGQSGESRKWLRRAVDIARQQSQPALEASWLIELGKLALEEKKPDEAESFANAALRIAKPRENYLTIFRAEWLLHLILTVQQPDNNDRHRLHYLRKLFHHLDQHEGIEEVQAFKRTAMRALIVEDRHRS